MLELQNFGIQSSKFVDKNKIQHRFPEILQGLQIPLTLLHNHPHCPTNYLLVYIKDFNESIYKSKDEVLKIIILVHGTQKTVEQMGYQNYETTIRPIRDVNEFETETGHIYVAVSGEFKKQNSENSQTAMNGKKFDSCYKSSWCSRTSTGAHYSEIDHQSW